jgi:hypothetical protein
MRKTLILSLFTLLFSGALMGQDRIINSFETAAEVDTFYWNNLEISDNADTLKSFTKLSHVNDPVADGDSALQVNYSAHNIETYGGYAKLEHMAPDSQVYDFSNYDSISFMYYVVTPPDDNSTGAIELRFELYDVSDVPDTTSDAGQMEFYYSFHKDALEAEPGWNTITIPLVDIRARPDLSSDDGEAFNRTGWAGIEGNDKLDKDKIKGFAWEFSIAGAGEDDYREGTIVFDKLALKGPVSNPVIFFNGKDFATGVGTAVFSGSSFIVEEGASEDGQTNAIKWSCSGEWAGFQMVLDEAKDMSFAWPTDSLRFKIKVPAGTENFRVWFEDDLDPAGKSYYSFDPAVWNWDGTWKQVVLSIKDDVNTPDSNPADSSQIKQLIFMTEAGFGAADIYIDNVWTGNPIIDVIAPVAPQGVSGVATAGQNYNLVIWQDIPGEEGESYNVYASTSPITDIAADGVYAIAEKVGGDTQSATHYLLAPGESASVSWYYAVNCVDAFGNIGPITATDAATTNDAKAIGYISMDVPEVTIDGDLSEWENSNMTPFRLNVETAYVTNAATGGGFDDVDDLDATIYIAVDNDYLYFAGDIVDDVYSFSGGNWWEQDAMEFFIGLYEHPNVKHNSQQRGAEPDYKFVFHEGRMFFDNSNFSDAGGEIYDEDSTNYFFEEFGGADYAFEAKISLDSIVFGGDTRFTPVEGMKVPFTMSIKDNDGGDNGYLGFSPLDTDNAYQTNKVWLHTFVGTAGIVSIGDDGYDVVREYALHGNYPNPFNPSTTITFTLAQATNIKLEIFNALGQKVQTLVNGQQKAGYHEVLFNAENLASGMYFYRLKADNFSQVRKMMLVK